MKMLIISMIAERKVKVVFCKYVHRAELFLEEYAEMFNEIDGAREGASK